MRKKKEKRRVPETRAGFRAGISGNRGGRGGLVGSSVLNSSAKKYYFYSQLRGKVLLTASCGAKLSVS
jgi:hypothetical protein